ncbi:hypothetical protein OROHE_002233 [Orobanche hederae]
MHGGILLDWSMGMHDSSLLHLVHKIKSWISLGNSDPNSVYREFETMDKPHDICCICKRNIYISKSDLEENCVGLSRVNDNLEAVFSIKSCDFCSELNLPSKSGRKCSGAIYPLESPRQRSPEPPSPSFSGEMFRCYSRNALTRSSDDLLPNHPSPISVRSSTERIGGNEREYSHNTSDLDLISLNARHEFYNPMSLESGPSDSPSRLHISSSRVGQNVQLDHDKSPQPLDFENNSRIWFPPPPDDINDETENKLFAYDDEDDDVGDSCFMFPPTGNIDYKEPWRCVVEGHFRALVSQLLQGEDIIVTKDKCGEDWVDIVTAIAWQAAKFIKPNTGRGGSMDPCDYLKVKCVASGYPSESKLVKGVVCTKNIKHKRMTSQYKNARLLILGGALEYQRVPNQLASFETLLQQENDHLKTIVSKIEAHHPNVLLVEKSVSSFALEHLLAKEISLVLNVKRPLLERIARCTGASITPSTEHMSKTRLGHCELFRLEKVPEEHEPVSQFNKKPTKTLMFFEGCPRRLGCTVVLRGSSREELKKVKRVVRYAVFAAYHLSLETSFLADEGANLPKSPSKSLRFAEEINFSCTDLEPANLNLELGLRESLSELGDANYDGNNEFECRDALSETCNENLALDSTLEHEVSPICPGVESNQTDGAEYLSANDTHQNILVSLSSHCLANGTVCERSRLVRIKFYGPSDKPLGRYLRDDLFDQSNTCRSCKESAEAHVICYTHKHANLTINVKHLPSVKLPGEQDGKIWMWHRCLRCAHVDGVPPATLRVVMSDAAWGLSFGKFLELSFSSHTTGNRVASCGHSLQRDCLRFYGFGSMVAFFRYSPIDILSVSLSPPILEFSGPGEQSWIRNEKNELLGKARALYAEVSGFLEEFKIKSLSFVDELSNANELHDHILELNGILTNEKESYEDLLQLTDPNLEQYQATIDIFEVNRLRHSLLISSRIWDRRLYLLDNLLKCSNPKAPIDLTTLAGSEDYNTHAKEGPIPDLSNEDNMSEYPKLDESSNEAAPSTDEMPRDKENYVSITSLERLPSAGSILSDKIDSAWCGADVAPPRNGDFQETPLFRQVFRKDNPPGRMGPTRVYSFDSAQRLQERIQKGLPPSSLYLSNLRSFHASGDYRYMIRDPIMNVPRTYSQILPREVDKLTLSPSFISPVPILPEGARLMVVQNSQDDVFVTVYENEPSSVISYALSSKEYEDCIGDKPKASEGGSSFRLVNKVNSSASDLSTWPSIGSLDFDYTNYYENHTSENVQDHSPHIRICFEDESSTNGAGKMRFSVTCYFAKQFDSLRRKCCPSERDFRHSLSRCTRWSAQGGKSNVYFAKSVDDRFIIKQVTKTELESFEEFAPEYFKYLTDALSSGSPTCLAKVLGIYQVTVKHMKGGKEVKMELMVMENLFYGRKISKVYDLKGSARSRYNPDTMGANKVLLDMNLLETLRTNPMFLGSKAKRSLERAVWNDTSFLASVDVMDYSLLVGVDEERKELVMGIIDFMRQYTWDKHLETWVKASGILGGPKNASPTIISPKQYKKRFRKAMTTYFLTVPDQWSS